MCVYIYIYIYTYIHIYIYTYIYKLTIGPPENVTAAQAPNPHPLDPKGHTPTSYTQRKPEGPGSSHPELGGGQSKPSCLHRSAKRAP